MTTAEVSVKLPKSVLFLEFRFPLKLPGYSEERCKELESREWVEKVTYYKEMASLLCGDFSNMPDGCLPHVQIIVRRRVLDKMNLTPQEAEDLMLAHIERDDSDKAEGEPPGL